MMLFKDIKNILVLSDTHIPTHADHLPETITKLFDQADMIIHAGDHINRETHDQLQKTRKYFGVLGNMDVYDLKDALPSTLILTITNDKKTFRIGVTHGSGKAEGIEHRVYDQFEPKPDCIIFGHSHVPFVGMHGHTLMFNPGSATDNRFQEKGSFGLLTIGDTITGEIRDAS